MTINLTAAAAVAPSLAVSRPAAAKLIECGVLGPDYSDGQRHLVQTTKVHDIAARAVVPLHQLPAALVVKPAAPTLDTTEDPREWLGWRQDAKPEPQRAGVTRWWSVRNAEQLVGELFIVSVSGVVVDVSRISAVASTYRGISFGVTNPPGGDTDAEAWRDIRIPIAGGGLVQRHGV